MVIVLRENVFRVSDVFYDNGFGQADWKITFLRLAAAPGFIGRRCLKPLHSITLCLEAEPFW